ncbi:hypothetical protein CL614_00725 [archaeon]|nr:hypothetical protein [archaeon]|tara:strand:- start:2007 stop:2474 length:468 start_codon:yes stop_codon:yes gene_type:complete
MFDTMPMVDVMLLVLFPVIVVLVARELSKNDNKVSRVSREQIRDNEIVMVKYAAIGAVETVSRFLKSGVHPDSVDEDGYTALHYAAANNDKVLVMLMLIHGARINKKTDYWETATDFADAGGHVDLVNYLIICGGEMGNYEPHGSVQLIRVRAGR